MDIIGRASLHDYHGDLVVYRDLEPADERLRGLRHIWPQIGLPAYRLPRKTEPAYARAIVHFLDQAQGLREPGRAARRLLYLGDTFMNDGTAIRHLGEQRPILGFIGHEDLEAKPHTEVREGIFVANRWTALADFLVWVQAQGFELDEEMVVLVDMDKTAFGARGRNDRAVDRARVEGVRRTVEEVLGATFDEARFLAVYDELNQPRYHPFTADNQDYLAYVSLMVSGGVYDLAALLDDLAAGRLRSFEQFVARCQERLNDPAFADLREVHAEVATGMAQGDPTPFKSFRRREYEATVARMGLSGGSSDLSQEIVITREVVEAVRFLAEKGVLPFAISDKPAEASVPTEEQQRAGYQPIHRTEMKVVGEPLYEPLMEAMR
ncbi:MAG: hypothetical protein ACE5MB_04735 [Anaerolineae bacterium]